MIDDLRARAESLGIKVDGRWKEAKLLQVIADASDRALVGNEFTETTDKDIQDMNAYAMRIWDGQSPDMPRHERIERVNIGLTNQGWGDLLEHLSLPNG